jgi:diguanylate cyclase (GGDEF)-like protein
VRILTEPLKVLEVLDGFAPDLILMDLHMPAASGDELAVAIREHEGFQAVPIVYVSDETDPDRQAEALGRGGDAFIAKPVSPDVLVRMVSRRIQASRTQRQQSAATEYRDPDTGLFTRRHFMNRLDRALSEPGCEDPGVGLLFVAIDNLSQVGDQVGAAGADLVQDRVGVMIRGQLGADDMASRLDRHCHALVLKRLDADSLRQAAEDLRQLIAGYPIAISGKTLSITASVGIAPLQAGAGDALGLIHCARRACADARRNGGNRIGIYGPKAQGLVEEIHEQRTAGLVERALADPDGAAGFRVLYQPLVAINVDQQQFLAVILCLASPDGEPTQDRDFWSAAEHGGLTPDVDRWLLLRALDALRAQSEAQPELRLFVPQHMASLIGEGWTVWLREQIQAFGLDKARPILELGFPDLLNHFNVASSLIKMLGKIGVDVCLTDVDQTAAAQDLVVDLQPRFVKVSPTALRQTKPEALMRVVDRLRRGGSQLIAAGVDMPDQIAPIWASGFNYAQGAVIQTPLHEPVFDWNEVEMR